MMSKQFTTLLKSYITVNALFLSTSETLKIPRSLQAVTLYAKQVLLCTKTVNSPTMAEPARNTAAHSNVQNREFAHAITKIGITAENAAVVPNMLLFPMIIVFLSTVNVPLSKSFMRSEPKPNVTIRVLSRQGKSAFGFTALMPHKT